MSHLPIEAIKDSFDRYPILPEIQFQYGTAGFRTEYVAILHPYDISHNVHPHTLLGKKS
jgi:hypothetical protein